MENGIIKGMGVIFVPQGTKLNNLETMLRSRSKDGTVKISHTWDELARWIGISTKVLKNNIEEYNSFCDYRHDGIFNKDRRYLQALRTPPFYAVTIYPSILNTIGGIKINHRMEVLDHNDNPLPGLYAVGVDAGGWESETYCAILSGSAFGFALNSGRIAGVNAAKYVLGD